MYLKQFLVPGDTLHRREAALKRTGSSHSHTGGFIHHGMVVEALVFKQEEQEKYTYYTWIETTKL